MLLTKLDALFLSKILFHYEKLTWYDKNEFDDIEPILDFQDRLKSFLTDGQSMDSSVSLKGEDNTGDSTKSLVDDDHEDDDEDDDEEELPVHSATISCALLHDLPATIDADGEEVEFEDCDGKVNILFEGGCYHEGPLLLIRRIGKSVEAWLHDETKVFIDLKKVSKEWKKLLEENVVYKVA